MFRANIYPSPDKFYISAASDALTFRKSVKEVVKELVKDVVNE